VNEDAAKMRQYGFIYADGSYTDERLPKGATLVPRRPSPSHKWDMEKKMWIGTTSAPAVPAVSPAVPAVSPVSPVSAASYGREAPAVAADPDMSPSLADMLSSTKTPEAGVDQ